MNEIELLEIDQNFNWHPCSQMKEYESFKPMLVKRAYDSYLELNDGRKIIDAISSWWCKSLGHNHPELKKAAFAQIEKFEHVLFARTTYDVIVELAQALSALLPGLNKISYASDGSSAVEIALKMSMHARYLQNQPQRTQFIALKNGYHGETMGALSVSDLGLYKKPYNPWLFSSVFIEPLYVRNKQDPLWNDATEHWLTIEKQLEAYADTATAIILEPIVQGAAGMKIYSQDFLKRLSLWAKAHDVHLIADEIMTGIGRTGKMLACEYAAIQPDFLCLSKGLTSGWVAFSVVLSTDPIYQLFYGEDEENRAFMHSHTYSGNALGASLALATLKIVERDQLCLRARGLEPILEAHMNEIAEKTGALQNVRAIGAIVAADLIRGDGKNLAFVQKAGELGALLRPLGNTLYWFPPLNVGLNTLEDLKEISLEALKGTL